ncbi:hypothetical protein DFS34DRAFT_646425 [Phlyctochytrium arcticum]|nr:hypothetical protein DFS34DRAFT_646425 [Phlyctochytrium arcticum]
MPPTEILAPLPSVLSSARSKAPQNTVPIDPGLVDRVEQHAQEVSAEVMHFCNSLKERMDHISSITYQSVQVTHQAFENLASTADESIAQMEALIAAVDGMSQDMSAVQDLAIQVKKIKESVEWLEGVVGK